MEKENIKKQNVQFENLKKLGSLLNGSELGSFIGSIGKAKRSLDAFCKNLKENEASILAQNAKAQKEEAEANKLIEDAIALEKAGCFAIVLEKIPAALAKKVSEAIKIPTIGIGAGPHCDGQVLVMHDMLGLNNSFSPRFLRRYANLHEESLNAIRNYVADVKSCDFPSEKEAY